MPQAFIYPHTRKLQALTTVSFNPSLSLFYFYERIGLQGRVHSSNHSALSSLWSAGPILAQELLPWYLFPFSIRLWKGYSWKSAFQGLFWKVALDPRNATNRFIYDLPSTEPWAERIDSVRQKRIVFFFHLTWKKENPNIARICSSRLSRIKPIKFFSPLF